MDININFVLISSVVNFILLVSEKNLIAFVFDKKRLCQQSKYDGSIIKEAPFISNCNIDELKKDINKQKVELLLLFIEKLEEYTTEENLKRAYKNLKTISIEKMSPVYSFLYSVAGEYDMEENKITYLSSAIGHEFLHMCSSYYDKENKQYYSGFRQSNSEYSIGLALNEGYTELLASRIYNKNNKVTAYSKPVKIAQLFELFFDNPKNMEKYYFNHDLSGFIHYMERFASKQEIIDILFKLDNALFLQRHTSFFPISYRYVDIQLTLYNWYSSNIKDEDKLQKFEDLLCENKIISMILNRKNIKLIKDNPYDNELLSPCSEINKSK